VHELRSNLIRGEQRMPLASKAAGKGGGRAAETGLAAIRIRREEARKVDQRREDRHLDVVDQAALRVGGRSCEVTVLNVSARGAMIESDLMPAIGTRVDIRFADCNRTDCFVRWVRDGRIGLEFGKETLIIGPRDARERPVGGRREGETPTLAVKGQRAPRQSLMLNGELHWRLGSLPVKLRNISAEGAMLQAPQDLEIHTEVVLEIAGAPAVPARVRWCRSRQIGIRFDAPFDLAELAHPHDEAPQSPSMLKPDYLRSETDPHSPWAARTERLSPDDL